MASTQEKIFPGDSFPVAFRCITPDETMDTFRSEGVAINPDRAYARLFDSQLAEFISIGPGVEDVDDETIEGAALAIVEGDIVRYRVHPRHLGEPGSFTLFLTAVFGDGDVLTEGFSFVVNEHR